MPPRKRRSRRQPEHAPEPEPVMAQEPEPTPTPALETEPTPEVMQGPVPAQSEVEVPARVFFLSSRTTRPVQEVTEAGYILSRRPGDEWRGRMQATWHPAGDCVSCHKPRFLLMAFAGEAAVGDLLAQVSFLHTHGACTCCYIPEEGLPDATL